MIASEKNLRDLVEAKGGFVNGHTHLDRANTLAHGSLAEGSMSLKQKWSYIDSVKRASTVEDYKSRIMHAIDSMRESDTVAAVSFIDADDAAGDRAITAAAQVRDELGAEFPLRLVNQGYAGYLTPEGRSWLDRAAEVVDIIGGMPEKDAPHNDKHLDEVLETAKKQGKLVHVHVDQLNDPAETETELVAKKTIEHGMEGKVWAVHSISLAAHKKSYRQKVYKLLKESGVGIVACPTAYLDVVRSEQLMPFHLPIAPLEELLEFEIPVALGTDNICDTYKPLSNGDMWLELRFGIELCRMYGVSLETLVDMATTNVRKAIGIGQVPNVKAKEVAYA